MISFTDDRLIYPYLSFVAKMIEITVHDMRNHFYFLGESGCLVEELLEAKSAGGHATVIKTARSIDKRAYIAADQIKGLGLLGQRIEIPAGQFDLNDAVKELMPFLPKLDRRKKIAFKESFEKQPIEVEDCASKLQFVVYSVVAAYIDRLDKGSEIKIETSIANGAPTITICADADLSASSQTGDTSQVDLLKTYLSGVTILESSKKATIAIG